MFVPRDTKPFSPPLLSSTTELHYWKRLGDHVFNKYGQFSEKKKIISYPLMSTPVGVYHGVRNVIFSENCAYVLDEWALGRFLKISWPLVFISPQAASCCKILQLLFPNERDAFRFIFYVRQYRNPQFWTGSDKKIRTAIHSRKK